MDKFEGIYEEEERNKLIRKEITRLKKTFKAADPERIEVAAKLINEAAFMAITLEETRKIVARDGIIEEYQNGASQKGFKKSSAVEVYDKMVNSYSKVVKQLCDLIPEENKEKSPEDEILRFAFANKKGTAGNG